MEYAMRKTERAARSVKTQFLIFLVTLFVFLLIFCILLIYTATQAMLSENLQYIQEDQTEFQTALNEMSSQAATAAKRIQYDTACRTFLSATQWNQISPSLIREVNAAIGAAQLGDSMLAEIAFVSDLVNWSSLFLPSQLAEMQQAMPEKRELVPLGIYTPGKPRNASYFVFGYRYYIGRDRDAALFLSVELTGAGSQLPISQIPGCRFILTDAKQDACLFGTDDRELPERLGRLQEKAAAADGGLARTSHWLVQCTELPQIGCTLLCVVDRWQNQPSMSISYLITVIFLLVFAGLLVFGIGMFYRSVISPLNEFSRTIAVIREKKLRKLDEPLVLSGCSELQAVGRDFSELLVSINTLTGEILQKSNALYEAEVLRQSAELDMLRSQINPHFLYNTLELIRAMAIKGDIDHVSMITSAMGKIYRYTAKGDSLVPLAQEVEIVKSYISIQQARFEGRITTLYSISPEAAQVPVFKMLLQPLVENAFIHGLESRPSDGTLYLGAKVEGNMLSITVRDNGAGITPEKLAELEARFSASEYDTSEHLGLVNISARLRLQYGDAAGLHITGAPGDGTCVSICIPLSKRPGKE